MNETRWEQLGAASGLGAAAVAVAAVVFERGPVPSKGGDAAVIAHLTENHGAILTQSMLFLFGGALYLWFVGSLRGFLSEAEGAGGHLSSVVFGAGVTWIGINSTAQAFQVGVAMNPSSGAPAALVGTMNALFTTATLPLAVMLTGVGAISLRYRALPAWLGWVAVAAAASQLVLWFGTTAVSGPLAPDGWLSYSLYPVFLLWLVPTSTTMIRSLGRRPPREVPEPLAAL
jgi:hypothetical protein